MAQKPRVFITGSNGFLGQALCKCLAQAGHELFRYCLTSRTNDESLPGATLYGDSFSEESLVSCLTRAQPDFVVHLASAGVIDGDTCPQTLLDINVLSTINLIEAAAKVGSCKVIHTGSCSEYACFDETIVNEFSSISPPNYYGATKSASVQLCLGLSKVRSVPSVVLRPFNLYGPGESPKRLIPYLIKQQMEGRECQLTHGLQQKDFLFIDDAATGFLHAIENFNQLQPHGIYNLCTGIPTTLRTVGEKIARLVGGNPRLYHWGARPSRAGEPQFIVGDPSLFMGDSGWKPATKLDLGLAKTIFYHRQLNIRSSELSIPSQSKAA